MNGTQLMFLSKRIKASLYVNDKVSCTIDLTETPPNQDQLSVPMVVASSRFDTRTHGRFRNIKVITKNAQYQYANNEDISGYSLKPVPYHSPYYNYMYHQYDGNDAYHQYHAYDGSIYMIAILMVIAAILCSCIVYVSKTRFNSNKVYYKVSNVDDEYESP
eukprot:TRINITY_DN9907_c0_g1_i1.p1 TRINITY_DN9907_c0_g1~~TRINITY_DN9907_c0_g1_i1.p1  ORF type:complete len:161 (+),score=27.48 TRINITY_DN9907_c0_g1_i1:279-761(+)